MNVVRMKVRLLAVEVDEKLDAIGSPRKELRLLNDADFWLYRLGGNRSRRWSMTPPKGGMGNRVAPAQTAPAGETSPVERTTPLPPATPTTQEPKP